MPLQCISFYCILLYDDVPSLLSQVRFMSHDPKGTLGHLGEPTKDVHVSMTSDAQISISPTSLTFDNTNWDEWQEVTVTANTDYLVEKLVRDVYCGRYLCF